MGGTQLQSLLLTERGGAGGSRMRPTAVPTPPHPTGTQPSRRARRRAPRQPPRRPRRPRACAAAPPGAFHTRGRRCGGRGRRAGGRCLRAMGSRGASAGGSALVAGTTAGEEQEGKDVLCYRSGRGSTAGPWWVGQRRGSLHAPPPHRPAPDARTVRRAPAGRQPCGELRQRAPPLRHNLVHLLALGTARGGRGGRGVSKGRQQHQQH